MTENLEIYLEMINFFFRLRLKNSLYFARTCGASNTLLTRNSVPPRGILEPRYCGDLDRSF